MTHTVAEALERFELIEGIGSETENKACAMTALAWVAGEAWTDRPPCASRLLASLVIRANDADGTSHEDRAEIVKAGEHGVLDTWWIPDPVVLWLFSQCDREASRPAQVIDLLHRIAAWKDTRERPAVLSDADLRGAVLRGAVLRGAVLRVADLSDADLRGAVLSDAVLSDAVLRGAVLRGADLRGADLSGADLRGADLSGAVGNQWTQLPAGYEVAASRLIVRKDAS